MKSYEIIRKAYYQVDKYYIIMIDSAIENNNNNNYLELVKLSRINEYAYFILFWGQFESFINDKVFELGEDEYMGMSFMSRVQILIPSTHHFYIEIDKYYRWRCDLAHGEKLEMPELTLSTIFDTIEDIVDTILNKPSLLEEDFTSLFKY